jgi:MoaA/NifB/PqqE/SkfB family radical SAM enzyme
MKIQNNTITSRNNTKSTPDFVSFDFLWLELTSRCNLECIHCYAESSPVPKQKDVLSSEHYFSLIEQASLLGCRKIQFIGGEPTIVKELPDLIRFAAEKDFDFIEVYTNAVKIDESLMSCFVKNKVHIAASFYSHQESVHDEITTRKGSFTKTSNTLKKLVKNNLDVRVGIISMEQNADHIDKTIEYVNKLGINDVGVDKVRSFGRGSRNSYNDNNSVNELCGSCWNGSLCVFPDGKVAPCIMSKNWDVGSVLDSNLKDILHSVQLKEIRKKIYQDVWIPTDKNSPIELGCNPNCNPSCVPECNPQCSPNCSPCYPYGKCNPKLFG